MKASNKIFKKIICQLLLLMLPAIALSQTGTIKGFVFEENTGEPVMFTNVYLKDTDIGASTDVNGYYSISKIPAGDYVLMVKYLGFETIEIKVTVVSGEIISKQIHLKEQAQTLEDFEVVAEKQDAKREVQTSVVKATPKEINAVPTVGGEADIATYMQTLPGVVTTGDQGGQMYVRGGSPIQNKVLLDGMVIYNPFHSIGFFSVFDTDIIRNADIYTGGFNAEYGGRISSVMDITTKTGNIKKLSGKVSASPFMTKLLLEGPLRKAKNPGDPSISYVLSGKSSYLKQTSPIFYPHVNDSIGLPFNFRDFYGKVSFNGSGGNKFNLFGFNFTDDVKYLGISDLNWSSNGMGSNFVISPTSSAVLIEGLLSFSNYEIQLLENELAPRYSRVNGGELGFDFTYFLQDDMIKYGVEMQIFSTDFSTFNSTNRKINLTQNTTEIAGYLAYRMVKGLLVIEPSIRTHYYASLSTFSPEPRIGLKFNINENFRIKSSAGVYSQNLLSANSDRDVVNLFYGFLSGPEELQRNLVLENGETEEITHALQKANHFIFGFEYDLNKKIDVNVEGYVKQFTQLTNMNRNKIFDDSPDNIDKPEVLRKDFIVETGDAMGVDFVAKYSDKKTYVWAVYSLGKVVRWDGFQSYAPVFDRRHNINFVATRLFGEKENLELSVRWNFGSGLPFTQTAGFYENITFEKIDDDYVSSNSDNVDFIFSGLNEGRLSSYHRLDLTLKRTFELKKDSKLDAVISVTNAYNRENIFYVNRLTNQKVLQLPVLPSIGVKWSF